MTLAGRGGAEPGPHLGPHLAIVAAAFWFGTTFVVVKDAVADVDPIAFLGVRFTIAALVAVPFARRRPVTPGWAGAGVVCGVAVVVGYILQTVGLQYTTSSSSAFITYLLVPMVPVLSWAFLRRPPTPTVALGIALSVVGLILLNQANLGFGKGEVLTLGCAVGFASHVVLLGELAPRHDVVRLTVVQLAVVAVVCGGAGLFLGGYRFPASAWLAAAYTGVFASALALGLQGWGQRRTSPSRAALLLALEPVFAGVVGYAVGDRLGVAGVAGALLILAAVVVSETTVWRPAR